MAWRLAKSLDVLRKQVNERWPRRSKTADGTIGDAAHASRSSDHNPWVKDGAMGVVTAIDFTNDPQDGVDSQLLAEALRASRDPRIKYIISNRRICSGTGGTSKPWAWRPYTGSNPHNKHVHLSVNPEKRDYDSVKPWNLDAYPVVHRFADVPEEDHPTAVVPVDAPTVEQEEQIQASAERDAEPRVSWLKRKWKAVTGWFSGGIGVGALGYFTDYRVIIAIGVCLIVVLLFFLFVAGPGWVRAWIRKQVA